MEGCQYGTKRQLEEQQAASLGRKMITIILAILAMAALWAIFK
jgi:hypothetical protein